MATTTNFGWETPDDTDLVKDGAAAIRTALGGVDTSFVDLKGGTTGQVLAKASGTDLDYTWTTPSAPSNTFYAGKNKIINGDLSIWQRGTSFTPTNNGYMADRWKAFFDGSGTRTYSQQTFTPGTAPVAGYEGQFFLRLNQSVAGTGGTFNQVTQPIENVRTFADQTVTMSFWAKAATTTVMPNLILSQNFGAGGSADVDTTAATSVSIGTSWTRYSYTVSVPSIAGKTIGPNNYLHWKFILPLNATFTFDLWGMQLEAGSTATDFQTATGTIQGELAVCQRYYQRYVPTSSNPYNYFANGTISSSSTNAKFFMPFITTLRTVPSVSISNVSNFQVVTGSSFITPSNILAGTTATTGTELNATISGGTLGYGALLIANNSTSPTIEASAEL